MRVLAILKFFNLDVFTPITHVLPVLVVIFAVTSDAAMAKLVDALL